MTGQELHDIRKSLNLSLKEFAGKIGVHQMSVWRWENTQRKISLPIARLVLQIKAIHEQEKNLS